MSTPDFGSNLSASALASRDAENESLVNKKPTQYISPASMTRINQLNVIAAIVQLGTWLTMFVLALTRARHIDLPWYSFFPGDRPDGIVVMEWSPVSRKWADVKIAHFSAAFLLLSGLYHASVSSRFLHETYTKNLNMRRNPHRWFEYSISASIMHVHIAMLSGMFSLHALAMLFGLMMITILFGYLAEPNDETDEQQVDGRAFWLGTVPFMIGWLNIFCYFFRGVKYADEVPDFVWSIIIIIFTLDCTFALHMFLGLKGRWWWKNYANVEIGFILLSLTSKQLLAWISYSGTVALPE